MPCPFYYQNRYFDIVPMKIRKSHSDDKGSLLEINFEYPNVNCENDRFSKLFNSFYLNINTNFLSYCEKKLIPRIKSNRDKQKDSFKSYGEIMKYYITLNTEKYVSVVTDIKHYNGYFTECTRFSCVWDAEKGSVLPYSYFLEKSKIPLKNARKKVFKKIISELENGDCQFDYTEENIKRYAMRMNPKNYFLTERGIAFWFDPGTLAPKNEGFPTYVLECNFDEEAKMT